MIQPQTIEAIVKGRLCHGCGVCAGLFPDAITMIDDEELGRRPVVRKGASNVNREAVAYCSGVRQPSALIDAPPLDPGDHTGRKLRDHWGPVLAVWEGHAADPEIRFHGSSGGVVTALAAFALETGIASAAIHTQPDPTDPALSRSAISHDRAALLAGAGSRYAPASPGEQLANIPPASQEAGTNGKIVFIGKPCDVASLRQAEAGNPALKDQVALVLGIFCAGVPSTKATRQLIDHLAAEANLPRVDRFRYRGQGWPGRMTASAVVGDAVVAENSTSYDIGWGKYLQPFRPWRCRLCADHGAEHADIAIGDPWYDQPTEQSEGRSLIVVRTERGRAILQAAIATGHLIAEPRDHDDIDRAQMNLVQTRAAYYGRALATNLVGLPRPIYIAAPLFRLWWQRPVMARARDIIGSLKRLIRRRLYRGEHPARTISGGG